ncbi:ANTAR domain-containing protein [Streptomyces sp. NPDC050264]|uniref:ANTAR domain-containing protein n=1 Tax=Streptomyces sp. NPDC050264 TaxID=3155038 RepID=UPI003439BF6B
MTAATAATQERAALQAEVARLRQMVRHRAVVDQAVGVLLALGRSTPAEAWDVLREMSMRVGSTLPQVARHLVEYGRSGELPDAVRAELVRYPAVPRQPDRSGAGAPAAWKATQSGPASTCCRPPTQ